MTMLVAGDRSSP